MRSKIVLMAIGVFAALFAIAAACLYLDSLNLKNYMAAKSREMDAKISQERETIKRDFYARYKSSMESYEAVYKEMSSRNKKIRDMEKNVKGGGKRN